MAVPLPGEFGYRVRLMVRVWASPGQTSLFAKMHWPVLREPLGFLRDDPPHATTIAHLGWGAL